MLEFNYMFSCSPSVFMSMLCHMHVLSPQKFGNSTVEYILNGLPNICLQKMGEIVLMSTADDFLNASQMNNANKIVHFHLIEFQNNISINTYVLNTLTI